MADHDRASLNSRARPSIEFRAATGILRPHIETFYLYRNDAEQIEGVERVDLGQLRYVLRGEGVAMFPGGREDPFAPVMIRGPGTAAARYRVTGPFHCFGISLRGIGWRTLIGHPAHSVADRILDATAADCGDTMALRGRLAAMETIDEMIAEIAPRLEAYLHTVPRVPTPHLHFLRAIREWAASGDPDLATLYAAVAARAGIGERQVQRLCRDYFAGSPAHLKRKFRAIGAAMRIYQGVPARDVAAAFSDQSHMINEIRHFTGHTPTTLLSQIDPVLAATLENETFHFLPEVIPELEVDRGLH